MEIYESVLTVVFLLLTAACAWNAWKVYRQAKGVEDAKQRKAVCRKAQLWGILGLMFGLGALYVVLRVSWIFLIVTLLGMGAAWYAVGAGLGLNMREH